MNNADVICPICGSLVMPDSVLGGLCPKCLMTASLEDEARIEHEPPSGPVPPAPGTKVRYFGDYELLEEIAHGGMGVVYKARQSSLNRTVALKIIVTGKLASEQEVARFRNEAEAAANLDHPNIVPIYEVGEIEGQSYFTMRFVEGGTLAEKILEFQLPACEGGEGKGAAAGSWAGVSSRAQQTRSRINRRKTRVAHLMIKVARAVHHAHQRGILHRDLKPGNILLDAHGEPFVSDFGLAKALNDQSHLTVTVAILGTPNYMSPEQAAGRNRNLTIVSDVFSLGAILYELLTGRRAFRGESTMETLQQVMSGTPERPSLLSPEVDRDLETICLKCLEKEPERRYPSTTALAEDLERWIDGKPIHAKRATPVEHALKWARREPAKAALAGVSCIAIMALAGIGWGQMGLLQEQEQRKEVEQALLEANQQRSEAERQRQLAGELQRLRDEDQEVRLEFSRIDAWFSADEAQYALASLARLAERFPSNSLVAERVLSELGTRHMPRLLFGPLSSQPWARSADGRKLVTISGSPKQVLQIWDDAGDLIHTIPIPTGLEGAPRPSPIRHCAFDPGGNFLATVDFENRVRLWDVTNGEAIGKANQLFQIPHRIHLVEEGTKLLALSYSGLSIMDVLSGQVLHTNRMNGAHWRLSPDGGLLAIFTRQGRQGRPHLEMVGSRDGLVLASARISASIMEFSTKGDLLAVPSPEGVILFETPTLQRRGALFFGSGARLLRFTPSDDALLAVLQDGSVELRKLDGLVDPLFRASIDRNINDVQFSPDGRWFATAGNDGNVRLFSSQTGRPLTQSLDLRDSVSRIWFSGDNEQLFTATGNSLLRSWDAGSLPPLRHTPAPVPVIYRTQTAFHSSNPRAVVVAPLSPPGLIKLWGDEAVPLPIPDWIPGFLEMFSGLKLNPEGQGEFVSQTDLPRAAERLSAITAPDLYERLARWALTPEHLRPASPNQPGNRESVKELVARNTPGSLKEALWLAPANALARARLARYILFEPYDRLELGISYESLLKEALDLAPDDPEIRLVQISILRADGRTAEATKAASEALARFPNHPAIREAQAAHFESVGRFEEALEEFELAATLAGSETASTPQFQSRFQLVRSRLLRHLGRETEAAQARAQAQAAAALLPRTEDWPSWGGDDPGRNMYSPARGLPAAFDPGRFIPGTGDIKLTTTRNVRWVAKLGSQSYGSVVVSGGKVFVGTNNEFPRDPRHRGDRSILKCLDEGTGEFLWQLVVPKLRSGKVNDWEQLGIISSPAVVGNRLYIVTSRAEVLCLDVEGMANGNDGPFFDEAAYVVQDTGLPPIEPGPRDADIIWRYDLMDELGVFPHNSSCSSPLVIGDTVYVVTGNGQDWTHTNIPSPLSPTLIALDRHTGELIAEDDANIGPRILHGSWSSLSAGMVNGRQLIFLGGPDGWCYAFDSTPVRGEDGYDYLRTVWKVDCNPPEYRIREGRPIHYPAADGPSEIIATPVFHNDRVYVAIGQDPEHGEGLGNLVCIDAANGDILWNNKAIRRSMSTVSIDPISGLLFIADFSGFVHCVDAHTGDLHWTHDMNAHIWPGGTLVADGKVYIGDEDGDFMVLAADRKLSLISQCNLNAPIYSTPTVANGVLYIKTPTHLFAVQDLGLGLASGIDGGFSAPEFRSAARP